MSGSVVDYENLVSTGFTDANPSVRPSSMRPRWERKRLQQQQQQLQKQQKTRDRANRLPLSSESYNKGLASVSSSGAVGGGDRFIPNRGGMNVNLSKHMLRDESFSFSSGGASNNSSPSRSEEDASGMDTDTNQKVVSDADKDEYSSRLCSTLLGVDPEDKANSRIMSFSEKAPVPKGDTVNNLNVLYSVTASAAQKKTNKKLVSRTIPSAPTRVLDAPDLMDDYYLNLLSWSDTNVLAVALSSTVYLWNASTGDIQELCTYEDGGSVNAHISSVA